MFNERDISTILEYTSTITHELLQNEYKEGYMDGINLGIENLTSIEDLETEEEYYDAVDTLIKHYKEIMGGVKGESNYILGFHLGYSTMHLAYLDIFNFGLIEMKKH